MVNWVQMEKPSLAAISKHFQTGPLTQTAPQGETCTDLPASCTNSFIQEFLELCFYQ